MGAAGGQVELIFDGYCGFCYRSVLWVQARDRRGVVHSLPSQTPGLIERLGLSREQVDRSAWAVDPAGKLYEGAAAINRVLRELGLPWKWLALLYEVPGLHWAEDRAYRWVANHRRAFWFYRAEPPCESPSLGCLPDE